jgi:hypothetical protein
MTSTLFEKIFVNSSIKQNNTMAKGAPAFLSSGILTPAIYITSKQEKMIPPL